MTTHRARGAALFLLLTGCPTPTYMPPDDSTSTTESTDSSLPGDTDAGPVETGWPVLSGEDLTMIDTDARTVEMYFNSEQQLETTPSMTWTIPIANSIVLLCDWNGDGLDDAWVLNESGDLDVNVYKNQGGDFADTAAYTVSPGFNAENYSFGCGDLSGDGHADLVAYKKDAQKLFYYPNEGGVIDTANYVKTALTGNANTSWLIDDYDGDGTDELGVLTGGTLTVYPVTDGTPQTSSALLTQSIADGYKATTLDLADDGRADLAIWNGTAFVVWPGTGSGFRTDQAVAFVISSTGKPKGASLR